MTEDDLMSSVSEGLKRPIKKEEIFSPEIKINHLKRIDKIFNKGIHYYLDPGDPVISKEASIFFRKKDFNTDLNIGAKKIVHHFEDLKISLSAISKLAEVRTDRVLPIYSVKEDPYVVAEEIRSKLYPTFQYNLRDFLKSLINKLAEYNILVFEFIETWNKKEKANIDGFFLTPNVIVLKRQQSSFRREIFTLAHELGHYLLNEEEIEKINFESAPNQNLSKTERWCNDFSFSFLAGEYSQLIENLEAASVLNDYHFEKVEQISKATHLSQLAIFTKLLLDRKLSPKDYNQIKADFAEAYYARQKEKEEQKKLDKLSGKESRGSVPKPIQSPLLVSTIQAAFYEGVINEYEVCKTLNIRPEKLSHFI